jgi:hypothetical protein
MTHPCVRRVRLSLPLRLGPPDALIFFHRSFTHPVAIVAAQRRENTERRRRSKRHIRQTAQPNGQPHWKRHPSRLPKKEQANGSDPVDGDFPFVHEYRWMPLGLLRLDEDPTAAILKINQIDVDQAQSAVARMPPSKDEQCSPPTLRALRQENLRPTLSFPELAFRGERLASFAPRSVLGALLRRLR